MTLLSRLRSKSAELSAPAEANLSSRIESLTLAILTLRSEVAGLRHDFMELAGLKRALEAKTWMAYQARHAGRVAGRVAGGVARAATARRDAHGRYVS